jgi:4-hydroxy-tetrahydrodipicolinate reductase
MGRRLIALAAEDPDLSLVCALEGDAHPDLGQDAGTIAGLGQIGVPLTRQLATPVQALIDFSIPEAATEILAACIAHSVPIVLATTGLSTKQQALIRQAAASIPIVWSPNMSLAVNLTMKLAALAAEKLTTYAPGVDVEIIERHHRFKEDAPSGTALRFGELIAQQMGQTQHVHGRSGRPGPRGREEIGYHALRTGDNPGEHTIVFGMLGETIELSVKATNRDSYALGALAAAKFIAGRPPGLYAMTDVLGL